jgi:hypothetical protein
MITARPGGLIEIDAVCGPDAHRDPPADFLLECGRDSHAIQADGNQSLGGDRDLKRAVGAGAFAALPVSETVLRENA